MDGVARSSVHSVKWLLKGGYATEHGVGFALRGVCLPSSNATSKGGSHFHRVKLADEPHAVKLFCFAVIVNTDSTIDPLRDTLRKCHSWRLFSSYEADADGVTAAFSPELVRNRLENAPELQAAWHAVINCLAPGPTGSYFHASTLCKWRGSATGPTGIDWVVKVDADTWVRPQVLGWMLGWLNSSEALALGIEKRGPDQPSSALLGPLQVLSIGSLLRMRDLKGRWPAVDRTASTRLPEDVWLNMLLDAINVSVVHLDAPPLCACRCIDAKGVQLICNAGASLQLTSAVIDALDNATRGIPGPASPGASAFLSYPHRRGPGHQNAGRPSCIAWDSPAFHGLKSISAHGIVRRAVQLRPLSASDGQLAS